MVYHTSFVPFPFAYSQRREHYFVLVCFLQSRCTFFTAPLVRTRSASSEPSITHASTTCSDRDMSLWGCSSSLASTFSCIRYLADIQSSLSEHRHKNLRKFGRHPCRRWSTPQTAQAVVRRARRTLLLGARGRLAKPRLLVLLIVEKPHTTATLFRYTANMIPFYIRLNSP